MRVDLVIKVYAGETGWQASSEREVTLKVAEEFAHHLVVGDLLQSLYLTCVEEHLAVRLRELEAEQATELEAQEHAAFSSEKTT
ncbi:MAG: hypothetical protein IPO08_23750 [Xanthomonadales bacterium]|nr:hypothetical protein [Xanthomonadales bacterium]